MVLSISTRLSQKNIVTSLGDFVHYYTAHYIQMKYTCRGNNAVNVNAYKFIT